MRIVSNLCRLCKYETKQNKKPKTPNNKKKNSWLYKLKRRAVMTVRHI